MSGCLLHVVAIGLVINLENEVLVSLRPMHMAQGGIWEFPGGKLESGENSYEALCRELKEEVNITVLTAQPFMNIHHSYDENEVILHVWQIKEFTGHPRGLEGQEIKFVPLKKLQELSFPKPNKLIIHRLLNLAAI